MATNTAEFRLGDLFVQQELITEEQLQESLKDAKENGTRVGFSLVKLGFIVEEELTRMLSKQCGCCPSSIDFPRSIWRRSRSRKRSCGSSTVSWHISTWYFHCGRSVAR